MINISHAQAHLGRRQFLKGMLTTTSGAAVANWGHLFNTGTLADEVRRQGKRCILLWMAGGPSQLETFDLKSGRRGSGPFRPIATRVPGIQICQYLPNVAAQADKLAIIRSMRTRDPGHAGGTLAMHTGYVAEANVRHPELGAVVAKFLGDPASDLPSFVQIELGGGESSPNAGAGYLGPTYQPFKLAKGGNLPENSTPYLAAATGQRRSELLTRLELEMAANSQAAALQAHRAAQERRRRLVRGRGVFDIAPEWNRYRDQYGDTDFGRDCLTARKLVEAGVPFVEVVQHNYDSHADNFDWHKALLPVLDRAWAGLMSDLSARGLLRDTLIIWMGEVGRTPMINNRSGRDHWVRVWSMALAGGGIKGGVVHGESDADGGDVKSDPVSEGDLFATIYTALGIDPRHRQKVGTRPIYLTPEDAAPIRSILESRS